MPHSPIDPAALTAALIRYPSVTADEGGALVLLEKLLSIAQIHQLKAIYNCILRDYFS